MLLLLDMIRRATLCTLCLTNRSISQISSKTLVGKLSVAKGGEEESNERRIHPDTDFIEGYKRVAKREDDTYTLYYRIFHSQVKRTPLVVLHGGPSLPSQYLYPLAAELEGQRPVLFYDQLGCGQSDQPKNVKLYSIQHSVDDLHHLLEALGDTYSNIHILGHSYGAVVALEYARRSFPSSQIQSIILSNAPTAMKLANDEYDRLQAEDPARFWSTHVCRTPEMPPALKDAFLHVGTVWGGMEVVLDYVAKPLREAPPTCIVRGEYDFGALASRDWNQVLEVQEEVTLSNCAHYPHFEDSVAFGTVVDNFCARHDRVSTGGVE